MMAQDRQRNSASATYYAMPSARTSHLWTERTPDAFVLDVKAFRMLTGHHTHPSALPKDIRDSLPAERTATGKNVYYKDVPAEIAEELWRRYREGIEQLRVTGRRGLVLFQFPPWVFSSHKSFEHVLHCQEQFSGFRLAVEFRHKSWFEGDRRQETLRFERDHDLVHVVVDEPQGFANSVPAIWEATSGQDAYVRLHGRNAETWNLKGLASSSERFNYLYPKEELREIAANVVGLSRTASRVHVFLNNNYGDYGVRNAADLARMVTACVSMRDDCRLLGPRQGDDLGEPPA